MEKDEDKRLFEFHKHEQELMKLDFLARVASLYDPMGLVSPFLLSLKLLLPFIGEEGVDWDSEVSAAVRCIWEEWLTVFAEVDGIGFNVAVFRRKMPKSSWWDSAAVYIVATTSDGVTSQLIAAKTRVAPLKRGGHTLIIPRK